MEDTVNLVHGVNAVKHVVMELKQDQDLAQILNLLMVVQIAVALAMQMSLKVAILEIAQVEIDIIEYIC